MNKNEKEFDLDPVRFYERLSDYSKGNDVLSEKSFDLNAKLKLEPRSVYILELE
jgi:hypothetical protein